MLKLIFWPVLVPSFLFTAGFGAVVPIQIIAAIRLGASPELASLLVAAAGVLALICTVPVGAGIDRVGDKRAMTWATLSASGALTLSALSLALPLAGALWLYFFAHVARVPATVAWGLARQSVLAETVSAQDRGKAMTALGGAQRAGALAGPLASALLLLWLPLWTVFIFALTLVVAATLCLRIRKLNQRFDTATSTARSNRSEEDLALAVRWPAVWVAGLGIITLAVARVTQPIIAALWGLRLGWNDSHIALAIALGSALEMVLMVPGGYLKDRVGRSAVLALCLSIFGAGFITGLALMAIGNGFITGLALMAIGNGFGAGINMTIGADLSPNVGRAKFLSIWSMFSQVAIVAGPLAVSSIMLISSLPVAFTVIGSSALGGAVWALATQPITKLPTGRRADKGQDEAPRPNL
ncbi:MFS transporter [Rothia nasimurium]|uniref:MFS transporter n=1 Tax=Rothia nasimurium TaxID=85336 RepID=A0A4Y9F2C1_9MICC|nr:MFS transporter [Rothia nasimurium]MBF0808564.1 MFS transporter [Rothia nasimurium]TFU21755.1 MFS transporter [Rothia nasimurium]